MYANTLCFNAWDRLAPKTLHLICCNSHSARVQFSKNKYASALLLAVIQ